ncbi:MAG: RNB domain-containing ribonuclease, partial [Sinomicrobium sp.]|nr:RNB domain-containing ribonuclease [Sinomicrobium sp.]
QRKNEITKAILSILNQHKNKAFNYKQIAARLGIDDTSGRNLLIRKLKELAAKQRIAETERGKYSAVPGKDYFTGTLTIGGKGNAYVTSGDLDEPVFIPHGLLSKALHGDEVEIYVFPRRRNSKRTEGEVVRIIRRKRSTFVGVVQMQKNFAFVVTADFRMYVDIFVPKGKTGTAKNGDKVLVEITDWPDSASSPYGEIVEVLGKPGELHTEMHAILAEYGLPYAFPEEVNHFTDRLETTISEAAIKKRRDMRSTLTFTIDPADAKDFDDALSFRTLENGNYEVGVHIADVSHYVLPGTVLDEEASKRGTSVYLVDRVVPMLPELLSNNVCSLRPLEDKLTFSVIFEMNAKAQVVHQWFGKTVICSGERFAYEEVQFIIENCDAPDVRRVQPCTVPEAISLSQKPREIKAPLMTALLTLNKLAKIMREKRMKAGAVSFDKIEVKFMLNRESEPVGVYFKEAKEANKLIEEF